MNKFEYKNLTPFKWFVLENFPFIEVDFDALTEWQLFCKIGKEINKIINSENNLGTQMENVTNAFIELQNYVNNYFDNLDVQDEINNKLNQMVEDGTLQEIITQYIQIKSLLCFDSVNDMKNATNLINGSYAKTYGFYNKKDGGGAFYKIREITNQDIVNQMNIISLNTNENLIAELITSKEINVLQFGAKADNIYDNTSIFQTASNYAQKNNLKFYIPIGNYKTNTFTLENIKIIKIEGTINFFENTQFLNIYENVNGDTPNIFINKITVGTIIMKGLNSADITIQNAYKLRLVADNTENHNFIGYNKFYLGFIRYLELWDDGSGSKWINENLFIGGRFLGISIDGTYPHQDNLFLKPMCEHTEININVGNGNRIIDARLEGSISITFGEKTFQNIITSNYSGTLQNSLFPNYINVSFNIIDNSNGLNRVLRNENLNENLVLKINAFNPYNSPIENDLLKPTSGVNIFESNLIELPNIDINLFLQLSNPNIAWRIECYDSNKQKLTINPNLLKNSPTLGYVSAGTYGNVSYNRTSYWAILDSSNQDVKYIKIKFYKPSTAPTDLTLKSIEMYMTYYGNLENKGYYLEGFSKSI